MRKCVPAHPLLITLLHDKALFIDVGCDNQLLACNVGIMIIKRGRAVQYVGDPSVSNQGVGPQSRPVLTPSK